MKCNSTNHVTSSKQVHIHICHTTMCRNFINFLYNPGHVTLWCLEVVLVVYARVYTILIFVQGLFLCSMCSQEKFGIWVMLKVLWFFSNGSHIASFFWYHIFQPYEQIWSMLYGLLWQPFLLIFFTKDAFFSTFNQICPRHMLCLTKAFAQIYKV